jgi:Zn-dependent protease/CBS domain-containing protein
MSWAIPLGRVLGTEIRLHLTFLLLLAWIGLAHGMRGGMPEAIQGVAFITLIFACVLLHEFGHVLAARRYGIATPDITLLPIGGVARLDRIPEKPAEELVVALAGPAVNVAIAALLLLPLGGVPDVAAMAGLEDPGQSLLARLFWVNVTLVVFNLIPAFPMDGGRVLRALLGMRLGNRRATDLAASIGQALAFGIGLLGLLAGAPLLVFVALFVWLGAGVESQAMQLRELSRGMVAADAMVTHFETLPTAARIADAVELLLRTTQTDFPVLDASGRLRGILTRADMIRALQESGAEGAVLGAMRADAAVVPHRAPLEDALRAMQDSAGPVGVTDGAGRLVGLLTQENLGEMLMVEAARQRRPARHGDAVRRPWPSSR